jgi:hypothetical protein
MNIHTMVRTLVALIAITAALDTLIPQQTH